MRSQENLHCLKTGTLEKQNKCMLMAVQHQTLRKNNKATLMMKMKMKMIMMNCFCGMVDRRKSFILISSRDHCQRSSLSRISNTPRAGFVPAQNLSSGFLEWSCPVVITTTQRHYTTSPRWDFVSPLYGACVEKERKESVIRLLNQRISSAYREMVESMWLCIRWWARDMDFQLEASCMITH